MEVELRAYIKPSSPNGRSDSLTYADIWLDRKSTKRHYYPNRWVLGTWGIGDLEILESWRHLEQESCKFYAKGLHRIHRDIPAYQAKMLALNQKTLVESCRPGPAVPLERLDQHQRANVAEREVLDDSIKSSSSERLVRCGWKFRIFIRKMDLHAWQSRSVPAVLSVSLRLLTHISTKWREREREKLTYRSA